MIRIPVGVWLAIGGLFLLPAASASLGAQEPGAQALIDQIRQIQGEIAPDQQAQEAPPQPDLSEEEVRSLLRDNLGVEVLRVEVVEHDGGPAYAVTVMTPPGNRNNALMVATLLVDGATGALLGERSSAPRAVAPDLPTATHNSVPESGGLEIRRRTLR
jgi:hypothetical protein